MARPGVTKEQVFEAADLLKSKGINPTVELVRAELGVGSMSTITPLMSEWREAGRAVAAALADVPPAVLEIGQRTIANLWRAAGEAAQKEIDAQRLVAQHEVNTVKAQVAEVIQTMNSLENELDQVRAVLASKDADLIRLNEELTNQRSALAAEQARNALLTIQASQAAQELAHAQQATVDAVRSAAKDEGIIETQSKQLDELRAELDRLRGKSAK